MFAKLSKITRDDFKKDWNPVETAGVKSIVFRAFDERGYDLRPTTYYTSSSDHALLTEQSKDIPLEEDVYLSHFALTENGIVVAAGFDTEDEDEHFYRVE